MASSLQEIYDEFERFFQDQLPPNIHELPFRVMESVERMGNELIESLNAYGPPSISLPYPPFLGTTPAPPPPPPPPPPSLTTKVEKTFAAHPYLTASGVIAVVALGIGAKWTYDNRGSVRGAFRNKARCVTQEESDMKDAGSRRSGFVGANSLKLQEIRQKSGRRDRFRGLEVDGYLKEAILILAPSPLPQILLPLALSLLKAGYIVLVAVPSSKEAEWVEKEVEKVRSRNEVENAGWGASRVLCYDPDDHTSLLPFQRSLWATLALRFPAASATPPSPPPHTPGDPYAPLPTAQLPHLQSILSLYALHPSPSPSAGHRLPALPAIIRPPTKQVTGQAARDEVRPGGLPRLITFVPARSEVKVPETFGSQVLASAHTCLAENLAVAEGWSFGGKKGLRTFFVSVGDIEYPGPLDFQSASPATRAGPQPGIMRLFAPFVTLVKMMGSLVGLGADARSWAEVERTVLRLVKARRNGKMYGIGWDGEFRWAGRWGIGHGAYTPFVLTSIFPAKFLSYILHHTDIATLLSLPLPSLTASEYSISFTPPLTPTPRSAPATKAYSVSASGESDIDSEVEGAGTGSLGTGTGSSVAGSGRTGLDGSWIGLEREEEEEATSES